MDRRPTYSQTVPFVPRNQYIKTHNPERVVRDDIVQRLFLMIEEGDLDKIKNFMLSNNLTTALRGANGETLAHVTIRSSNISKTNKYKILQYLISRQAPLSLPDSDNITPLHIACKLQLKDIVSLLISEKVLPNMVDNQGMTPLHYQVQSESHTCNIKKEIGPLIPNNSKVVNEFKKINDAILSVMYSDNNVNKYITHIKNTIKNYHNLYPEKLHDLQYRYILDISDKIVDANSTLTDKNNKIYTTTTDYSVTMVEFLSNNLKDSLNKLSIHPNYTEGWGPDGKQMNNILQYNDISEIIDEIETYKRKLLNDLSTSLRISLDPITNDITRLLDYFSDWKNNLVAFKNDPQNTFTLQDMTQFYRGDLPLPATTYNYNLHETGLIQLGTVPAALVNDAGGVGIINNGYYFISNFRYILAQIGSNMTSIRFNLEDLIQYLESDTPYYTYNLMCTNIAVQVQNAIIHLIILANDTPILRRSFSQLRKQSDSLNDPLRDDIDTKMRQAISETENVKKTIVSIYSSFNKFISQINSTISIINMISAQRYIKQYHNNLANGHFLQSNTDNFNNLFDRSFQQFPTLPPTLLEYQKNNAEFRIGIPRQELLNAKRKIFEIYIPQYTFMNYASFITNSPSQQVKIADTNIFLARPVRRLDGPPLIDLIPAIRRPRIGYALSIPNLNNTDFVAPNIPQFKYGNRTKYYASDNNDLTVGTGAVGFVGVSGPQQKDKVDPALPSVAVLLDRHFVILKYLIIKHIISSIYAQSDPQYTAISNAIGEYKDDQKNILLIDIDDSVIYTLIGRLVDISMIHFINICIREVAVDNISTILNQMEMGESYDAIFKNITQKNNTLLLDNETSYEFNLNETIDSIIEKFYNPIWDNDIKQLNYTAQLATDENINAQANEHVIYNYSMDSKNRETVCYNLDPSIIDLLVLGNARINEKDFSGNTPLYYAIDLQNTGEISTLLKYGASVNNNLSRNLFGITPMLHALRIYLSHLETLQDSSEFTNNLFKESISYIEKKPEYNNNVLLFSNNIFKTALLMINHQFYLYMKQGKWDYNEHIKLLNNIKSTSNYENAVNKTMPILQFDPNSFKNKSNAVPVIDYKNNYLTVKIDQLVIQNNEIDSQISNLTNERNDIQARTNEVYYQERFNEINAQIRYLITEKNNLEVEINNYKAKYARNSNTLDRVSSKSANTLVSSVSSFQSSNIFDVVQLYNKVFTDVTNFPTRPFIFSANTDVMTYLNLWDNYIHNVGLQGNLTQIHLLLVKYQRTLILDSMNNNVVCVDKITPILSNINKLHSTILGPFARDYDELPQEYSKMSNHSLTTVMDIIIHVTRHNLCAMLYSMIVKLITKHVESINTNNINLVSPEQFSIYISSIVQNVINVGKNGSALLKYIMDVLPRKIVKITLNIFENEHDPDKTLTSNKVFDHIINILVSQKVIPITKNSIFVQQMNDYIFPYFLDIFALFINKLKTMMDNYMAYLINESRQINILAILLDKASHEKNI